MGTEGEIKTNTLGGQKRNIHYGLISLGVYWGGVLLAALAAKVVASSAGGFIPGVAVIGIAGPIFIISILTAFVFSIRSLAKREFSAWLCFVGLFLSIFLSFNMTN